MRIGLVIGSLGLGGSERVSIRLTSFWLKQGHEVVFFTTKKKPSHEYSLPIHAHRYDCFDENPFFLIGKLRHNLKWQKPDVLIAMGVPISLYVVPSLMFLHIPLVVAERGNPDSLAVKRRTRTLSKLSIKFAQGLVFQTEYAQKHYKITARQSSRIILNPLDVSALPEVGSVYHKKKIVAVGRLVIEKNYGLLLNAFSKFSSLHPEYILEIYGDGPEREKIANLRNSLTCADKIKLMGARDDVLTRIADAEIYVLTSISEGMPNSLMEAMAIGLPVIATNCPAGGCASLIESGRNGILIPMNDESALVSAMELLVHDFDIRKALSENALQIRETCNQEKIGQEWISFLTEIQANRSGKKIR